MLLANLDQTTQKISLNLLITKVKSSVTEPITSKAFGVC